MPRSVRSDANRTIGFALMVHELGFSAPPVGHPQRDASLVWQSALHILRKQVRPSVFDCCLKDSRALTLECDTLTVIASTPYAKEFLQKHLAGLIARTVSELLNRPIRVHFVVTDGDTLAKHKGRTASRVRVFVGFLLPRQ